MAEKQDEIILQSKDWCSGLGSSLLHMQERGLMCDIQLCTSNGQHRQQSIAVHGCVLAACSTTLSTLVQSTANRRLHLALEQSTLEYIVTFCYIGKISIKHHDLQSVHKAATEYGIKELQTLCVEFLATEPHKEPMPTVNASFESGISTPMATSQLPILSKIEGLDTFESSQELTFDVHFPSEPSNSLSEHPKPTEIQSAPSKAALESYLCIECGKIFDKLVNLQMHEKRHKTENSGVTFTCKLCQKVFKSKQNLQVHSKKHADDKAFQCAFCAKKFVRKTELTMHERIHTGDRPYTCKYCNKAFAQSTNLKDHERTHTGAKPYACDRCDATFSNGSNLRRHKKFHDRRLALGLPQQLRQKSDQMRILPTGEKIYPCNTCDKHFKHLRNLEDHLRTHTGEKPFKCSICQRGFARQPNLIRHEKFHKKKQSQGVKELKSKITPKTMHSDQTPPIVGPKKLITLPMVNAQKTSGYEPSQNVFLATDTSSLATGLHQTPSSVPLLVRPLAQSSTTLPMTTVSCSPVQHSVSSVPNTDMFSATVTTQSITSSTFTVSSSSFVSCAVQNHHQSSVPLESTSFLSSESLISVSESGSQVSSSPHAVSSVHCFLGTSSSYPMPSYLKSVSLIPLSSTLPHAVSESNFSVQHPSIFPSHPPSTVPHSISSVPQASVSYPPIISSALQSVSSGPPLISAVPHMVSSVPQSISSVPNLSSAVPQLVSSVPHSIASVSPITKSHPISPSSMQQSVDPNLSVGSSSAFSDPLGAYFGPGGFIALDGVPFPQTLNANQFYSQPTTESGSNNHLG